MEIVTFEEAVVVIVAALIMVFGYWLGRLDK